MLAEGEVLTVLSLGNQFMNIYVLEFSLVCGFLMFIPGISQHLLSWLWWVVLMFTLLVVHGTEWTRNRVAFAMAVAAAIMGPMVVAEYLSDKFAFFAWLWGIIKDADFLVTRSVMLATSILCVLFQVFHWIGVYYDGRWKLSNQDFERLKKDQQTASWTRDNLATVHFDYPDYAVLKGLGLGNVVLTDINNNRTVIENVLGLPKREHLFRNLLRAEAEVKAKTEAEEE